MSDDLYLPPNLPADAWPFLPAPDFFERDVRAIKERMIARYQALTEKTVFPAQPERLFINTMAYEAALLRIEGEIAARENLLRYATSSKLDLIGERIFTPCLPVAAARTTLRFAIDDALGFPVAIPAGARVATADQSFTFSAESAGSIEAGQLSVDLVGVATTPGVAANGLLPGQINLLVDAIPFVSAVANITESNSGADAERDDRYRERIRIAPNRFSTAGPEAAYLWRVTSASQTIIDVAVLGPEDGINPGEVHLYPLSDTGLPTEELKQLVLDTVAKDQQVRPLTDSVSVFDPVEQAFTVQGTVTPLDIADANTVLDAATAALVAATDGMRNRLGADIVRGQLRAAAQVPGLYDITLTQPAADVVLARQDWANCTGVMLTLAPGVQG